MSIIPYSTGNRELKINKKFRNVIGSTKDLYPDGFHDWREVYTRITGIGLTGYRKKCPGCGTDMAADQFYGGHIVLGSGRESGSAPEDIDFSYANAYFAPVYVMDQTLGKTWSLDFPNTDLIEYRNRVFLLPICTTCNRQSGVFTVQEDFVVAHLINYGYTDNYSHYLNLYETGFFMNRVVKETDGARNKFTRLMKNKVENSVIAWKDANKAMSLWDYRYTSYSPPAIIATTAQPAQPAQPYVTTFGRTIRPVSHDINI
jgi:hypothetical protein